MIALLATSILLFDPAAASVEIAAVGAPNDIFDVRVVADQRGSLEVEPSGSPEAVHSFTVARDGTTYRLRRAGNDGGSLLVHVVAHVPCCVPLVVDVARGSLTVGALANSVRAHVESGSLAIDLTHASAERGVVANVENGSLDARLPPDPAFSLRATVENAPPETWNDGSSLKIAGTLTGAVHTRMAHGSQVSFGDGARATVTLSVTNGLMRLNVAPPTIDGISCDAMEGSQMHVHAVLRIVEGGRLIPVPADIGRPAGAACYYWLHTHTADGIIHVESPSVRSFTLGQLADVWKTPLDEHHVAGIASKSPLVAYVNGKRWVGSLRSIPLWQHADIQILSGPRSAPLEAFTAWGGL